MRPFKLVGTLAVLLALAAPTHAVPPGGPEGSLQYTPGSPRPSQSVSFFISAHDPDGVITSITLEYGDGARDSLPTPHTAAQTLTACLFGDTAGGKLMHQFAAGNFVAKLTVTSGSCPLAGSLEPQSQTTSWPVEVSNQTAASTDTSADATGSGS